MSRGWTYSCLLFTKLGLLKNLKKTLHVTLLFYRGPQTKLMHENEKNPEVGHNYGVHTEIIAFSH